MAMKNCHECSKEVSDKAAFCPHCGVPYNLPEARTIGPAKSRSMAIFRALIFGGWGAHKFYLERPGWGVLYLLFCWTFVPSILGVLEAIAYLSNSEAGFQKTYCKA